MPLQSPVITSLITATYYDSPFNCLADPVSRHGREIVIVVKLRLVSVVLSIGHPVFNLRQFSGDSHWTKSRGAYRLGDPTARTSLLEDFFSFNGLHTRVQVTPDVHGRDS
jgi:hypothetical protein